MQSKRIRSFADLDTIAPHATHVLTLFSGGLDSSYVLKELADRRCRVTALLVDVGEGACHADLRAIADRFGAALEIVDAREEFVGSFVLPAIRAQAKYLGIYPISSSLSRPLLTQVATRVAQRLGCDTLIHTANQSQNSLRRLNGAICQLGFKGWYGSPYEFSAMSREEKIQSLRSAGLQRFQARGISGDANVWVREFESGSLDNPEAFWIPDSLFEWTAPADTAFSDDVSITFDRGAPVALNGESMGALQLIACLNRQAGSFGIGRYCGLEHLDQGEKVLEVREAPAATLLMDAYRHLETASLDYEVLREKSHQEQLWVREAVEGRWFGSMRESAEQFIAATACHVGGEVRYKLRAGAADVCAIRARAPLYLKDRDAWEKSVARERSRTRLSEPLQPVPQTEAA
jgi:argininosuccinate synthase